MNPNAEAKSSTRDDTPASIAMNAYSPQPAYAQPVNSLYPPQQVIYVGGSVDPKAPCPADGQPHIFKHEFSILGIMLGIWFFPIGLLCCFSKVLSLQCTNEVSGLTCFNFNLVMREGPRCTKCHVDLYGVGQQSVDEVRRWRNRRNWVTACCIIWTCVVPVIVIVVSVGKLSLQKSVSLSASVPHSY